LGEKKSWNAQLTRNVALWNWSIQRYPYTGSVNCWDCHVPVSTINQ
jgi:hypothetical protein